MLPLLLVWLTVVPLLPAFPSLFGAPWYLDLALVAAMALLAVPRLLRGGGTPTVASRAVDGGSARAGDGPAVGARPAPLRAGLPAMAVGIALLSMTVAVLAARPEAPRFDLAIGALTGLAHAGFFLLCLGFLPDAEADAAEVRRTRLWLGAALGLLLLGQLAMVLVEGQFTDPLHRPDGTMGNPNVLGTLVGAVMLAFIGLSRLRGPRLLALLPLVPLLVLTRSRGALAATGVTALLLAVHWRLRPLLIAVAVLVALLFIVPNPLRDRVFALQSEHDFSRLFLWRSALERSADVPLGIGPGMNRYDFPLRAWDAEHPWLLHQRHAIGLTHNVFITLWLEWGWAAGAALLVLAAGVTARLLRARLLRDDPLALGAALGACVFFLELQVDGIEQNPVAFPVFLLLLATALARVSRRSAARGVPVPRRLAAGAAIALALVLGAGLGWRLVGAHRLHEAQAAVADFEAAQAAPSAPSPAEAPIVAVTRGAREVGAPDNRASAERASAPDNRSPAERSSAPVNRAPEAGADAAASLQAARTALDAAESLWPRDADSSLARFTFERGRVQRLLDEPAGDAAGTRRRADAVAEASAQAFAALERARATDGLDPELPELGAQLALHRYYKLGRQPQDLMAYVKLMRASLALDPLNVDGHWDLAQEAQRTHQPVLAEEQLAEVFRLEPDHAYAWYVLARLAQAEGSRERSLYCYVRASEAVLNCQLKVLVGNPASQAFYQRNLERVDLVEVWKRIWDLRRDLYF